MGSSNLNDSSPYTVETAYLDWNTLMCYWYKDNLTKYNSYSGKMASLSIYMSIYFECTLRLYIEINLFTSIKVFVLFDSFIVIPQR